ncbi:MAG: phosphatase PAP2 family protein [Methylobacter sp.]|nr:phosphatase PAP2 family protein [Methylobacter sp.]
MTLLNNYIAGIISLLIFLAMATVIYIKQVFWFDEPVLEFFAHHRTPFLDVFFSTVTWLGSLYLLIPIVLAGSLMLKKSGYGDSALFLGLGFGGAMLVTNILKRILGRTRPQSFIDPALLPLDSSFPSGHATHITALMLCLLILHHRFAVPGHWATAALLVPLIILVALSRLYLQVHFLTDIIGGILVAVVWVLLLDCYYWKGRGF